LRWRAPLGFRVVAGVFSISKPYFAANSQNFYTELGTVRHRGAELSLSGSPVRGLRIVAGAVLLDARVTGPPARDGQVGRTPVDQPRRTFSFNANYDLARVPGLSVWLKAVNRSSRYADSLDLAKLPPATIVDAGIRYRLRLVGRDALARLSIQNLGNVYDWQVAGSGGYQVYTARQISCALTIDL
jgi:iron complex outermembrane receptor protein